MALALLQHKNDQVRFEQQVENSRDYVLPFIKESKALEPAAMVMEIGCGEGGVLKPFLEAGCIGVGVDLNPDRIKLAKGFLEKEVASGQIQLICENVYNEHFLQTFRGLFDLIILKDAIEHIPEQERFIPYLRHFLKPQGQIFFGFPPWYMPFGGHQQICERKWTSKLPYYHLLPKPLYKGILKIAREDPGIVRELMEIHDTQITIERFERIVHESGFLIKNRRHYLINPIYKYKFGMKPKEQYPWVTRLPFLRNFITTCVYYTIG